LQTAKPWLWRMAHIAVGHEVGIIVGGAASMRIRYAKRCYPPERSLYMDLGPYITVEQMAKYLQIGRTSAYELTRAPGFPAVRLGRTIRIPSEALMQWLSQCYGQERVG